MLADVNLLPHYTLQRLMPAALNKLFVFNFRVLVFMNGSALKLHYCPLGNHTFYVCLLAVGSITQANADQGDAPLNYFLHSFGPAAKPTLYLGWVMVALSVTIFIIIALLLLIAILHKRERYTSNTLGPEEGGMRWVFIGTGISTGILFALALYMLVTLNAIAKPTQPPGLTITVTGYDWWWKVEYAADDPTHRIVTANEIHIPVGVPVLVKLKSADVIHAFWIPMLAGKTQMIPGLINQQWLQADAEGIYRGQCTQYCGLQHAHMGIEVIAQTPEAFQQWQAAQHRKLAADVAVKNKAGLTLFMEHCAGCHTISGTEAVGAHAPDLTHLNSRRLLAAGLLPNTPEHLLQWITHAQELKPGARMPNTLLTAQEMTSLSAFLSTLN